jgi:hypothetical protein
LIVESGARVRFELRFKRMPVNSDPRSFVPDRSRTELRRKQACQRTKGREAPSVKSRGPRRNSGTKGPNGRTTDPGEPMCLGSVAEGVGFEPSRGAFVCPAGIYPTQSILYRPSLFPRCIDRAGEHTTGDARLCHDVMLFGNAKRRLT